MIIAFPPCTDLCVSGARHFAAKRADGRQQASIDFFMLFANHPCPRVAIENPVGIMSKLWRKPDQIVQPWMFGEDASKATCLWLKGLQLLRETNRLPLPLGGRWANQTPSGQNKLGPSEQRARLRSKTYAGIAEAMAQQWAATDEAVACWTKCECCDDYICNIHGTHAYDCDCEAIEWWMENGMNPYITTTEQFLQPIDESDSTAKSEKQ